MPPVQPSSDFSVDQKKFMAAELLKRAEIQLVLSQYSKAIVIPRGHGNQVTFTGYNRTPIPMSPLPETQTPASTPMSVFERTATADEYGMYFSLGRRATLTTRTPIVAEGFKLIGDAMGRVVEYVHHAAALSAPTVQYWDGSRANRGAITATDYWTVPLMTRAKAAFSRSGAQPRDGEWFVCATSPEVMGDITVDPASLVGWVAAQVNTDDGRGRLERGKVGRWAGYIFIQSNFFPVLQKLADVVPVAGGGGALSGTVYHKVTRRSVYRGHEETIGAELSTVMGANTSLAFTMPATADYVYHVYAGAVSGDANLFRVATNVAPGATFTLNALLGSGFTPPETPPADVQVHPMYLFGMEPMEAIELNGISVSPTLAGGKTTTDDPLAQRYVLGSVWPAKVGIRYSREITRIELASRFPAAVSNF